MKPLLLAALVSSSLCCVPSFAAAVYNFSAYSYFTGTSVNAQSVNARGEVAVNLTGVPPVVAVWSQHGTLQPLGSLPGLTLEVHDLNAQGSAVGNAYNDEAGTARAVIWRNGVPSLLPTTGASFEQATGINERGMVAGAA